MSNTILVMNPHLLGGAVTTSSVDVRTTAADDVAYINHSTGSSWNAGSNLGDRFYPLETTTANYGNSVRWLLPVPKNATITAVTVTFYEAQGTGTYNAADQLEEFGFNQADNPGQTTSASDYLTKYGSMGTEDTLDMSALGTTSRTTGQPLTFTLDPTLIQELVDRAGWVSGNAILCFMRTYGSDVNIAQWKAHYNQTAAHWPRLQVTYEV